MRPSGRASSHAARRCARASSTRRRGHEVHHGDKVQVDRRDGVHRALSEQRGLPRCRGCGRSRPRGIRRARARRARMRADPGGQEREQGRRCRIPTRGRAGAAARSPVCAMNASAALARGSGGGRFGKGAACRRKRPLSPVDAAEWQVSVGADQTGRQARAPGPRGKSRAPAAAAASSARPLK